MDVNLVFVGEGLFNKHNVQHRGRSLGPAVDVHDVACIHVNPDTMKPCGALSVITNRGGFAPNGWLCSFHASELEKAHREALAAIGKANFRPTKRDDYNFVPAPDVPVEGDIDLRLGRSFSLKKHVWSNEPELEDSDDDLDLN